MGRETGISWTDHTFNPWRGCVKISEGCANCYAETMSHRNPGVLGEWGPNSKRSMAAESYWKQPIAWNRAAEKSGERRRVFCASLGDVFEDRKDLVEPRNRMFKTIRQTPNLDWLLLTKRPQNWRKFWPLVPVPGHVSQNEGDGKDWELFPNIWMGTSVENQERADERIPKLLEIPALIRFLSIEPLLGPIDILNCSNWTTRASFWGKRLGDHIHWAIVGGESGHGARPCEVKDMQAIVRDCKDAGIKVFVKQYGSNPTFFGSPIKLEDKKGGNPEEWLPELNVREFPK